MPEQRSYSDVEENRPYKVQSSQNAMSSGRNYQVIDEQVGSTTEVSRPNLMHCDSGGSSTVNSKDIIPLRRRQTGTGTMSNVQIVHTEPIMDH